MSAGREWDVLGVGDIDVDVFVRVQRIPGRDEKAAGDYLGEFPGGMIANFCCAASRLGVRSALAAVVGDDAHGAVALEGVELFGVDTSQVRVRPGGRTFFCVVFLDASGEKALTTVRTDCHLPRRADLDLEALGRTRLVHLMGDDLATARWLAREARARGTLVSLDMEAATMAHGIGALAELLGDVELAFVNDAGLREELGTNAREGAERLRRAGARVVVATLGARGCVVAGADGVLELPAVPAAVVDTTGAGDCFNAAFVAGHLRGWGLERCARFATAAASLSLSSLGARGALPDEAQVEGLLGATPA